LYLLLEFFVWSGDGTPEIYRKFGFVLKMEQLHATVTNLEEFFSKGNNGEPE
jgi:hypothetical protein